MMENITQAIHVDQAQTASTPLPFSEYIRRCQLQISKQRPDLHQNLINHRVILEANSPFELAVSPENRRPYGALLIHGLLASPFSLKDIALDLQQQGIFNRSILLPGHGTKPEDLLTVSYQDWLETVQYGIASLSQTVDRLFLIGYSAGATLSIYHALHAKDRIAGIILIAPAVKIKVPFPIIRSWHYLQNKIGENTPWIYRDEELDYAKYASLPYHAVAEVAKLTEIIATPAYQTLHCPVFIAMAEADETVSSKEALRFFLNLPNRHNRFLLYTQKKSWLNDQRVIIRPSRYPDFRVENLSHIGIPFRPQNFHYGQTGDYSYASHINETDYRYGAYNQMQVTWYEQLYKIGLTPYKRQTLSYHPDYDFMSKQIIEFMQQAEQR